MSGNPAGKLGTTSEMSTRTRLEKLEEVMKPDKTKSGRLFFLQPNETADDCLRREGAWPRDPDAMCLFIEFINPMEGAAGAQ